VNRRTHTHIGGPTDRQISQIDWNRKTENAPSAGQEPGLDPASDDLETSVTRTRPDSIWNPSLRDRGVTVECKRGRCIPIPEGEEYITPGHDEHKREAADDERESPSAPQRVHPGLTNVSLTSIVKAFVTVVSPATLGGSKPNAVIRVRSRPAASNVLPSQRTSSG
jgi:hypothetical protein